jgi:hypothetical protein
MVSMRSAAAFSIPFVTPPPKKGRALLRKSRLHGKDGSFRRVVGAMVLLDMAMIFPPLLCPLLCDVVAHLHIILFCCQIVWPAKKDVPFFDWPKKQ